MRTHRLKIGVDIDGVLITMDPKKYLEFCAKEFGWQTSYEVFSQTHSWSQATGQTKEVIISEAWGKYLETVEDAQSPIEGAHAALKELGSMCDIYLITARSNSQLQATESVLRKHLPDVKYIELSMGNLENKTQPVIDFALDYYIDDSYREIVTILECKEITTKIIPFPSFYALNRWDGLKDERLIWLTTWGAVEHGLEDARKKVTYQNSWEEIRNIIQNS